MPITLRDFTDVWDILIREKLSINTIGGVRTFSQETEDNYSPEMQSQTLNLEVKGGLVTANYEETNLEYDPVLDSENITLDSYE